MNDSSRTAVGRSAASRRVVVMSMALLLMAGSAGTCAEDSGTAFNWGRTYAGLFAGSGLAQNQLVDVDGFANWGYPGSLSEYDDQGFAWGALAGSRFDFAGAPLRFEVDATFGGLSASTDRLDPEGRDETAIADYQWLATARAGVEDRLGGVTLFATGGLAAARIDNSVTDIDFFSGMPPRMDPDDSFRDSSTHFGWVIGVGVETALPDSWTLRLEGSYLDFGQSTYHVNRSGDNRCCGSGTPRRPVRYHVENSIGVLRLGLIRTFGP